MLKMIRNQEQMQRAEKVISMLAFKIRQGTATPEEQERYAMGTMDALIYDWGTENYQEHVPNMIAAAEERKAERKAAKYEGLIAKRTLPDEKAVVPTGRPELRRRAGRFAV